MIKANEESNYKFRNVDFDFFSKYLNANAPTGYESTGQKIWIDHVKNFADEVILDNYGSAIGVIKGSTDYKVVIEAHADEISWGVNYIDKNGYIYVARNGGSDYDIAPGMRGYVHLDNGDKILGVFGWAPVHIKKKPEDYKLPSIDNVIFDCGCSSDSEVLDKGIHPGSIITFDVNLEGINNGKYYVCRAFDNRSGGVTIAEASRKVVNKLKETNSKLPFTLYICNCVQEEIGLRGAQMVADRIKPDLAICTDVCHDTQSPFYNKIKQGDIQCTKGPVISFSPSIHNNLRDFILKIAKENNVKNQILFSSGTTCTDTDSFAYSNGGVPSALISLPLKYMHTTVEMISAEDLDTVIDLFYHILLSLKPDFNTKYFNI